MKQLFGDQELALDIEKIKKTLVRNMLRVHLASIDKRLEACKRCPLIVENPGGFSASGSSKNRIPNYKNLYRSTPVAYYDAKGSIIGIPGETINDETLDSEKPERTIWDDIFDSKS